MFEIKRQLMWSKLRVGLVITASLAVLLLTVFFAGSIEHLIVPRVDITASIRDVKGLREGSPVWLSGVEVGTVQAIALHPKLGTVVTLSVQKSAYALLQKDAEASVLTMGLLGDKYVELSPGSSQAGSLGPGDMIKGRSEIEFRDVMETSIRSIGQLTAFMERIERFIDHIESGEGTLARLIRDPSLYTSLRDTSRSLSVFVEEIRNSRGTLRLLIEDPSLYTRISATTDTLQEFSRKLNTSQGTLGRLLEDPSVFENLEQSSVHLSSILDRIDRGEGLLGAATTDQELVVTLHETVVELRGLLKDMQENPKRYFKFSLF